MGIKNINIMFFSFFIILSIFFHQYGSFLPGVTFGELMLILASALVLLFNGFNLSIEKTKTLIQFYGVCLLLTLFSFLIQQHDFIAVSAFEVFSRLVRYFAYVIFIVVSADKLDANYALKIYRYICIFVSLYIILQTLGYYAFNFALPVKILPLPFSRESDMYVLFSEFDKYYYRAYGPFAEPGYAAKFLLPGLAISLFDSLNDHKNIVSVMLISAGIIFTTSVQGVLLAVFSYIYFGFFLLLNKELRISFNLGEIFIVGLLVMLLSFIIYSVGILDTPIERISSIFAVSHGGTLARSSTGIRVYRGFALFAALPTLYKIIGVGMGNLGNFVIENNIYTNFDYFFSSLNQFEYVNAISGVLLSSGIIGGIYFIFYVMGLYKNTICQYRLILLQLIVLFFAGDSFFSMTTVFYLSLIYIGLKAFEGE